MKISVLFVIFFLAILELSSCLTFNVDKKSEECFYIDHKEKEKKVISVIFQVISGGRQDIDLHISGPDGSTLVQKKKQKDGKFSFNAQANGLYKICFSNRMSSVTRKVVSMEIDTGDVSKKDDSTMLTPLGQALTELESGLKAVMSEQKILKMREQTHRYTNINTNRSLIIWSIIQSLIAIGIVVFQVYYLKKFFESKRSL